MADEDPNELVGMRLGGGRFVLEAPLGRGGMGSVFRALDTTTGAACAVKLLHPHLARETRHLDRFRREAEVVSELDHPHAVRALATGVEPDGTPWIAMELLAGRSLSREIKRCGMIAPSRAIRIARQILAGVGAAHAIGVIHRDLKPGNVVFYGDARVKVVDFGLARFTVTSTFEALTRTGQILGTPAYMAPEQAIGDRIDERADVYAVGAILHAMLTGEPPYGRGGYAEILPRMLAGARESLLSSHSELGELGEVVERALAVERDGRYASTTEMDRALARLDPSVDRSVASWTPPPTLASLRLPPVPELDPKPLPPEAIRALRATVRERPTPRAAPSGAPPSAVPSGARPRVTPSSVPPREHRAIGPAASGAAQPGPRRAIVVGVAVLAALAGGLAVAAVAGIFDAAPRVPAPVSERATGTPRAVVPTTVSLAGGAADAAPAGASGSATAAGEERPEPREAPSRRRAAASARLGHPPLRIAAHVAEDGGYEAGVLRAHLASSMADFERRYATLAPFDTAVLPATAELSLGIESFGTRGGSMFIDELEADELRDALWAAFYERPWPGRAGPPHDLLVRFRVTAAERMELVVAGLDDGSP